MTVRDFADKNRYSILSNTESASDRIITGVYTCDLLSMAMAGVKDGNLWITVHTNINVVAVAALTNASCVIIPESIPVEEATVKKAGKEGIIIICAPHNAYDICTRYYVQSGGAVL